MSLVGQFYLANWVRFALPLTRWRTAPDALGRPMQAGSYATGVQYQPDGSVASYTLGNGVTALVDIRWRDDGLYVRREEPDLAPG